MRCAAPFPVALGAPRSTQPALPPTPPPHPKHTHTTHPPPPPVPSRSSSSAAHSGWPCSAASCTGVCPFWSFRCRRAGPAPEAAPGATVAASCGAGCRRISATSSRTQAVCPACGERVRYALKWGVVCACASRGSGQGRANDWAPAHAAYARPDLLPMQSAAAAAGCSPWPRGWRVPSTGAPPWQLRQQRRAEQGGPTGVGTLTMRVRAGRFKGSATTLQAGSSVRHGPATHAKRAGLRLTMPVVAGPEEGRPADRVGHIHRRAAVAAAAASQLDEAAEHGERAGACAGASAHAQMLPRLLLDGHPLVALLTESLVLQRSRRCVCIYCNTCTSVPANTPAPTAHPRQSGGACSRACPARPRCSRWPVAPRPQRDGRRHAAPPTPPGCNRWLRGAAAICARHPALQAPICAGGANKNLLFTRCRMRRAIGTAGRAAARCLGCLAAGRQQGLRAMQFQRDGAARPCRPVMSNPAP